LFSETLIAELALRDELEYEEEVKNTFISLAKRRREGHLGLLTLTARGQSQSSLIHFTG
jgi:hypothetical protein